MFSLNPARLCQSATRMIALLAMAGVFIMFTAANSSLFAGSHSKVEIVPCDKLSVLIVSEILSDKRFERFGCCD